MLSLSDNQTQWCLQGHRVRDTKDWANVFFVFPAKPLLSYSSYAAFTDSCQNEYLWESLLHLYLKNYSCIFTSCLLLAAKDPELHHYLA